MICIHKGCSKQAAKDKVYCNKHLHGQRSSNPVHGTGSSYSTLKNKYKKSKNKKSGNMHKCLP